jgi:hypothetical protein
LIGTLIVYGAPAAGTAAAVLAYRIILFWLPLRRRDRVASLRRDMPTGTELASCTPAIASQSAEVSVGAGDRFCPNSGWRWCFVIREG